MPHVPRILLHNDKTKALADRLVHAQPQAEYRECNTYAGLQSVVEEFRPEVVYTVRFAGTPEYPREALFAPAGPRWIANGGVGTDHFGHWDPRQTTVTNAAGVASDVMAEFVIGAFLHFTLDIPGLEADKSRRIWRQRSVRHLMGKSLLIIGLGHTGRAIAARAKAFRMHVIGTRSSPAKMQDVDEVHGADAMLSLLPRADFIAIATPLTLRTRGMIGPQAISAMRPEVVLADVSRGSVVDQSALLTALKSGRVAGAALDVFETEPLPEDSQLWQLENVLISPHCSSVYEGWELASFDLFLSNLERWISGRTLKNVVDPERGY